jgi:hypothetical protein
MLIIFFFFFFVLEPEMIKIKFSLNQIFSVGETGVTLVQHKPNKVIGKKGKMQIESLSSAEGRALTIVPCMSASSQCVSYTLCWSSP